MLKIVVSRDQKTAWVIYSHKTISFYSSDGAAFALVKEMILEPVELQERCDEVTQVVDLKDTAA